MPRNASKSYTKSRSAKKYLGSYYEKDFRYLSPEVVGPYYKSKSEAERRSPTKLTSDVTFKFLLKTWLQEVIRGLKQFLYKGSLHGIKYIFEPTFSRLERVTWIIIIVISVVFCSVNITQLFSKWNSTPFVNVLDSLPSPVWAVPFPLVVLCPQLHVKLSYANVSKIDKMHQFFASQICPHMPFEDKLLNERLTPYQNNLMQEFINNASPKCTDVVKLCYWRVRNTTSWDSSECCDNFFSPMYTNYGLCFAFNALPLNGMTNHTTSWQKTFNPKAKDEELLWGLDSGYPKIFPPDPMMQPLRVMGSGETNGLGLELYMNTSEHQSGCDGSSVGFNVLVSSPTDHVYTSTVIRVPMDRMTTIEVSPITYKTDYELRTLSPDRRQCFFQNERKLQYFAFYTDTNCKHDLLIQEVRKTCDCVQFNWPRKRAEDPICSTDEDFDCIEEVNGKVEEKLIYAYYRDSEEQRHSKGIHTTSCHPSCNDILYYSQAYYSDLKKESDDLTPEWGTPKVGELTRINVHFYEDIFLGQHRHAQYDDYYFVGAIGGLLSLFLGFSIISVAELVYFVVLRPVQVVLRETWFPHI